MHKIFPQVQHLVNGVRNFVIHDFLDCRFEVSDIEGLGCAVKFNLLTCLQGFKVHVNDVLNQLIITKLVKMLLNFHSFTWRIYKSQVLQK
jgi:hypothetical protein